MYDAVNEKLNEIYASMSIDELQGAQVLLAKLIEARLVENREKAIEAARAAAKALGFKVEDLFGAEAPKKAAGKAQQIYVNPNNPAETWSGRGRTPKWFTDAGMKKLEKTAKS